MMSQTNQRLKEKRASELSCVGEAIRDDTDELAKQYKNEEEIAIEDVQEVLNHMNSLQSLLSEITG